MALKRNGPMRRDFLKYSGLAGFGAALGDSVLNLSYAASRERLTILSSIALDTLHPYAHSSSPHYGIWNNMLEPLVEVDYGKKTYFGILAQSWEFQGRNRFSNPGRRCRMRKFSPAP